MSYSFSFFPRMLRVSSIDNAVSALWRSVSWSAKVHSCYHNALNLIDGKGNLVIVLPESRLNGPYRVLTEVSDPFSFKQYGFLENDIFIKDRGSLCCFTSNIIFDIRTPRIWSEKYNTELRFTQKIRFQDNLNKALQYLIDNSDGENGILPVICKHSLFNEVGYSGKSCSFLSSRIATLCAELIWGIRQKNLCSIKRAIKNMIGIGKGLTPSGDDIVGGFISALHFAKRCGLVESGEYGTFQKRYIQELLEWFRICIEEEVGKTSYISQKFLRWTSLGRVSEEVISLCNCIIGMNEREVEDCAQMFLLIGSTSGREVMLGVVIGLSMIFVP